MRTFWSELQYTIEAQRPRYQGWLGFTLMIVCAVLFALVLIGFITNIVEHSRLYVHARN